MAPVETSVVSSSPIIIEKEVEAKGIENIDIESFLRLVAFT